MKTENMSLEKIREVGLDALEKALGPVGMARFLMQFEKGGWDYTKERPNWLDLVPFEEICQELEKRAK